MKKRITEESEDLGIIDQLIKSTPLNIRLTQSLIMNDKDNWENGSYKGERRKLVPIILEIVDQWIKDGMPNNEPFK